jgi:hypothetical protein
VNFQRQIHVKDSATTGDYWDTLQRKTHGFPEQDLLLAVLKDGLLNFRKNLGRPGQTRTAERKWFFDADTDRLFSFESVCAGLGLSPQRIRAQLLAWEKERSDSANLERRDSGDRRNRAEPMVR